MNREKRYLHTRHILGFIGREQDKYLDIEIHCSNGVVAANRVVLAALSPLLKQFIHEADLVVIPDADTKDIHTFFRYLLTTNLSKCFDPGDLAHLENAVRLLHIEDESVQSLFDKESPSEVEDESSAPTPVADEVVDDEDIEEAVANDTSAAAAAAVVEEEVPAEFKVDEPHPAKRPRRQPQKLINESAFVRNKSGTGTLKCKFCPIKYRHIKARNKHMLSEHLDQCQRAGILFRCSECGARFTNQLGRAKHMLRLHPTKPGASDGSKQISEDNVEAMDLTTARCPFDDITFRTVKELRSHMRDFHPEKERSCIACGMECGTKESLMKHIQTHETGSKEAANLLNCDHCNMKFLSEYNLVGHKRDAHSTSKSLVCAICQKVFKNAKFLKNHEDRHKTGEIGADEEEFRCSFVTDNGLVCSKVFKQRSNLERHLRSHQKIKPHRCEECGKCFVDSTRLKEHRWIHSDYKPHKCQHCGKVFRHVSHMRNHMANSHGAEKQFSCDQCPKKFVYAYQLKSHVQVAHATPANPSEQTVDIVVDNGDDVIHTVYQCSLCHAVFPTYHELQTHCVSHTLVDQHQEQTANSTQTVLSVGNEQILLEVTNDPANNAIQIDNLESVIGETPAPGGAVPHGQDYYVLYESEVPLTSKK